MLKKTPIAFTLSFFSLLGNGWENYAAQPSQKTSDAATGTLQKMIVESRSVTDAYAYAYTNTDANCDTYSDSYIYADCDAEAYSYTTATPDSASTPNSVAVKRTNE
jgi:hypothetical protein